MPVAEPFASWVISTIKYVFADQGSFFSRNIRFPLRILRSSDTSASFEFHLCADYASVPPIHPNYTDLLELGVFSAFGPIPKHIRREAVCALECSTLVISIAKNTC